MLGYFPDPYPDEAFYSLCARFSDTMSYPTKDGAILELFGELKGTSTLAILPTHLSRFIAQLPPQVRYTAEQVIDEHTLFTYYAFFLPTAQRMKLREVMQGDSHIPMRMLAGRSTVPLPQWLRYCPLCVEAEREFLGKCYWHRLHQVTGVEVCPLHQVFLQKSAIRLYDFLHPFQLVSAQQALQPAQPQSLDPSNAFHQTLLQIARDTAWILSQNNLSLNMETLQERYLALLSEQGLANHTRVINRSELAQRLRTYYSPEFLVQLYSPLDRSNRNYWFNYLLHRANSGHPPLRHLLLMHFLGFTAEQFFDYYTAEHLPFGVGPWPCLNLTCKQYRQFVIQECQVSYTRDLHGRPSGLFSCKCGFVYCRTGPDKSAVDQFRIGKIKAFGLTWETVLRERWSDPNLTIGQLANLLGVISGTVKKHAALLALPFPRPGGRVSTHKAPAQQQQREAQFAEKRATYRTALTQALQEHPEWGVRELQRQMSRIYIWLWKHDRTWLQASRQPKLRQRNMGRSVSLEYWKELDETLAEEVPRTAKRLRNVPGRPIRITKHSVGAEMNQIGALSHYLDRLPLTAKALNGVVETHEAFALRRIRLLIEDAQREGFQITRKQLRRSTKLMNKSPAVQQAIEAALAQEFL